MEKLDQLLTEMAAFKSHYIVTGQTYSRKVDLDCLSALGSLGSSVHKVKYRSLMRSCYIFLNSLQDLDYE